MSGIGLLNEKPLHAALKLWCARKGDQFEVALDGYVIDIVRDDVLLEIQTRSLGAMKAKLSSLLRSHRVRVIHPIAREKWIVKPAADGDGVVRRKSPRVGRVEDVFWEMVRLPHLISHPNFSLEVLLIREEELRRFEGKRRWRRKGWATEERRLIEVVESRVFAGSADWLALLPADLGTFTVKELAEATGIRTKLAQKMAYCLCKGRVVDLVGTRGRANLYAVAAPRSDATPRARRRARPRSTVQSSLPS